MSASPRRRICAAVVAALLAGACVPLPAGIPLGRLGGGGSQALAVDAALAAVVFSAFADAAEHAGCEPLLVGAWRDAALELGAGAAEPVPDSIRRIAAEQVDSAGPQIRALCAERTPRLERLRQIRLALAEDQPSSAPAAGDRFAPVYFEPGQGEVRDDSVRARLRQLGQALASAGLPVTLRVDGFTGSAPGEAGNGALALARARAVIAELRRGGLAEGCCVAAANPGLPYPAGHTPRPEMEERLARRVTFSFGYREEAP